MKIRVTKNEKVMKRNKYLYDRFTELLHIFDKVRGYSFFENLKKKSFEDFVREFSGDDNRVNLNKINTYMCDGDVHLRFFNMRLTHTKRKYVKLVDSIIQNNSGVTKFIFVFDTRDQNFTNGKPQRNTNLKRTGLISDKLWIKLRNSNLQRKIELIHFRFIPRMYLASENQYKIGPILNSYHGRIRKRQQSGESCTPDRKRRKLYHKDGCKSYLRLIDDEDEKKLILERYRGFNEHYNVLKIKMSDMVVKATGGTRGDLISMIRSSESAGRSGVYRRIV